MEVGLNSAMPTYAGGLGILAGDTLTLEGRKVQMRVWRHLLRGITGHTMLVLFLDTQLPENSPEDQTLTDHLYGGGSTKPPSPGAGHRPGGGGPAPGPGI